jgi:hypothetical protein
MQYFHLEGTADYGFDALVPRGERVRRPAGCVECESLPRGASPPDRLQVRWSTTDAVLASSWGFGVIRRDLLDALGPSAGRLLQLGKLVDQQGKELADYRTFTGRHIVLLRGGAKSQHWICGTCGRLNYTCVPRDTPYITKPAVASREAIYATGMELLVSDSVRDRIGDRWSPALRISEVPVMQPRDRLPEDLDPWPTPEQRVGYKRTAPDFRRSGGGFLEIDRLARGDSKENTG